MFVPALVCAGICVLIRKDAVMNHGCRLIAGRVPLLLLPSSYIDNALSLPRCSRWNVDERQRPKREGGAMVADRRVFMQGSESRIAKVRGEESAVCM